VATFYPPKLIDEILIRISYVKYILIFILAFLMEV
jgi:hypothetical protein